MSDYRDLLLKGINIHRTSSELTEMDWEFINEHKKLSVEITLLQTAYPTILPRTK